jgi:hypothetical protein
MYNYSARRKQGLGSLRPGYSFGGPTGFLIGNLLNWGLPKVIDYATKSKEQREEEAYKKTMQRMGITPYFPDNNNDDEEKKGTIPSSGWKGGLMNLLATAFLGPLMGPLALTVGKGLMNKSKGLGFTGGEGGSGVGPKVGPKIDYYTGSDEEDKDIENQITKDFDGIDSGGWDPGVAVTTTSAPSHIGPSNGDSGGGSDGWSGGAETQDSSGWESSPFFKGGRVSYSKGGLTSLWQR